ncbi:MAG: trypsin-like peptidase domain-containing protein [Phycisphaeraceae bacterium]|nr:trypsin-like peptidase domain-containing protein [Phycisphaeraceae bacterium]
MNRIRWYGPSLLLMAALLATMWLGPQVMRQIAWAQQDANIVLARNSLTDNPTLAELSDAYRKVAEAVEPSVVHIEVLNKVRRQSRSGGPMGRNPFEGTPFEDYFRDFESPRQTPAPAQPDEGPDYDQYDPARPEGNGSGWVYDDQGHIVTNRHVVAGADEIRVTFHDGGTYDAELINGDELTDIAVLKVKRPQLHSAELADEQVEPGDIVFAFGSPFGFSFSMSQGIVSAKGRDIGILSRQGGYENFIQTDAAINPGNSGGPLTNIRGQVVGMNSAIATRSRNPYEAGWMGIGFAIPVDMIRNVVDQIIASGSVSRGYLGVYIDDLKPEMAKTFGYDGKGVLVDNVSEDGPAAGKLQPGDIITAVNGKTMDSTNLLRRYVAAFPPETIVKVTVFRPSDEGKGQIMDVEIKLGKLPSPDQLAGGGGSPSEMKPGESDTPTGQAMDMLRRYGIEDVGTFTQDMATQIGATFRPGVLIQGIRSASAAAPLQVGRPVLITRVMGADVADVDQLMTELAKHNAAEGVRVRIAIWDGRGKQWTERFWLIQAPANGTPGSGESDESQQPQEQQQDQPQVETVP